MKYRDVGGNAWAIQDAATSNEGNLRLYLNLPQGRGGFANLLPTQDLVDEFEVHDGRPPSMREIPGFSTAFSSKAIPMTTLTRYMMKAGLLQVMQ